MLHLYSAWFFVILSARYKYNSYLIFFTTTCIPNIAGVWWLWNMYASDPSWPPHWEFPGSAAGLHVSTGWVIPAPSPSYRKRVHGRTRLRDQSRFPSRVWNPPLKKVNEGLDGDRCAKPLFCLHETPREKAYVKSFLTNQLLLTRTGSCTPLAFSLKQDLTSVFIGYKTNLILRFLNFEVYLSLNWQYETQLECPSFPH